MRAGVCAQLICNEVVMFRTLSARPTYHIGLAASTLLWLMLAAGCSDPAQSPTTAATDTGTADVNTSFGDGKVTDTAKPSDTGSTPDTGSKDTSEPIDVVTVDTSDTAQQPDVAPDTAAADSSDTVVVAATCKDRCDKYDPKAPCQCDSYCSDSGDCCDDYATLCAATAGCKVDKDCDDFDPCTTDACAAGACKHTGTGACCKADSDCDDFDACTTDKCTSSGCGHTAKTCNDGLDCTTDSCDSKSGACAAKVQAGFCAIDNACHIAGELDDNSCMTCDPSKAQDAWTAKVGTACDDGLSCTTGDVCDAKGTCVGSAKAGCCKTDADCGATDPCSGGACTVATGICTFAPKTNCCAVGTCCDLASHTIKAVGAACGTTAIQVDYACNGNLAQKREGLPGCDGKTGIGCLKTTVGLSWTAWKTLATCTALQKCVQNAGAPPTCENAAGPCAQNSDCDDKNPCTDDSCLANTCSNLPKACPGGATCQVGACDPATGKCGLAVADTSCFIGNACYASGAKHPTDGCLTCQPSKILTDWSLTTTCACTTGVCCNATAGKIQPQGASCDTALKATEYACSTDGTTVQTRTATQGCTGKSNTCSTSASNYAWTAWTAFKTCTAGTTCEVTDPTVAGTCKAGADPLCGQADKYEVGTTAKTAYNLGTFADDAADLTLNPQLLMGGSDDVDVVRYTVTDNANTKTPTIKLTWTGAGTVKVCAWYACSAGAGGNTCKAVICPSGAISDSNPDVSGVAGNGCCLTGATGTLSWTPAPSTGTDASGTAYVAVTNTAGKCQQVSLTASMGTAAATDCTPGSKCCTADGSIATKATACGTTTVAAEYKCDSTAQGGKIMQRKAVQGCTGNSTTCSVSAINYAWSDWTAMQTCAANEVCNVTAVDQPGTCKAVSVCAAGSTCCSATGAWATAGTACGSATQVEYKCSGTTLGASAQVRKATGGCSGTSATCSTAASKLVWSSWGSYQACTATQLCVAGSSASLPPICQAPASDLCSATDPSYGTTTVTAPKDLGTFSDAAAAVWMAPKVALSSDTDKDFFKYKITDDFNLNDPKVSVTWSTTKPVTVCAYYQCLSGPNGTDCDPITCPTGSTGYNNSVVSSVNPNGCCIDGASGTLTFAVNAPGTLNEDGYVHFNIKNKTGSGCQQVGVKLAFGGSDNSACSPATSCCADNGSWAAKGTACGAVLSSEYQCSATTAGGISQKRDIKGTCGGTAATCGTTTTTPGSWSTALACTASEFCATPDPTAAGVCVSPGSGSCSNVCGGKSATGTCYCDAFCAAAGDCCADFGSKCGGSCTGACGGKTTAGVCWCDSYCSQNGDCCLDKAAKCGN